MLYKRIRCTHAVTKSCSIHVYEMSLRIVCSIAYKTGVSLLVLPLSLFYISAFMSNTTIAHFCYILQLHSETCEEIQKVTPKPAVANVS